MFRVVFEGICGFAFKQPDGTGDETRVFMPHQMPPMSYGKHNKGRGRRHDSHGRSRGGRAYGDGSACPDHISTLVAPTGYFDWGSDIQPDALIVAPDGPTLGVWYLGADPHRLTTWSAAAGSNSRAGAQAPGDATLDGVIDLRTYFKSCSADLGRLGGKDSLVSLHGGRLSVNRIGTQRIKLVDVSNSQKKEDGFYADQIRWDDYGDGTQLNADGLRFSLASGGNIRFKPGVSVTVSNQAAQFDGLAHHHFLAHYSSFDRKAQPMIDTEDASRGRVADSVQGNCGDPAIIP